MLVDACPVVPGAPVQLSSGEPGSIAWQVHRRIIANRHDITPGSPQPPGHQVGWVTHALGRARASSRAAQRVQQDRSVDPLRPRRWAGDVETRARLANENDRQAPAAQHERAGPVAALASAVPRSQWLPVIVCRWPPSPWSACRLRWRRDLPARRRAIVATYGAPTAGMAFITASSIGMPAMCAVIIGG